MKDPKAKQSKQSEPGAVCIRTSCEQEVSTMRTPKTTTLAQIPGFWLLRFTQPRAFFIRLDPESSLTLSAEIQARVQDLKSSKSCT